MKTKYRRFGGTPNPITLTNTSINKSVINNTSKSVINNTSKSVINNTSKSVTSKSDAINTLNSNVNNLQEGTKSEDTISFLTDIGINSVVATSIVNAFDNDITKIKTFVKSHTSILVDGGGANIVGLFLTGLEDAAAVVIGGKRSNKRSNNKWNKQSNKWNKWNKRSNNKRNKRSNKRKNK